MNNRDWNAVFDVLVQECGAGEWMRQIFIDTALGYAGRSFYSNNRAFQEFRFQGSLGFGGKLWYDWNLNLSVDCYPEDLTPERAGTIERANKRLLAL